MARLWMTASLLLVIVVSEIECARRHETIRAYFVLSLQWNPGRYAASERRGSMGSWTIHGLWPSNTADGEAGQPSYCPAEEEFKESILAGIKGDLEKYWPSMKGNNVRFWKSQWEKHGTCAHGVEAVAGVEKFFKTTLKIYKNCNVFETLSGATPSIIPSITTRYSLDDILQKFGNRKVLIICSKAPRQWLREIRFCLNTSLEPEDCAGDNECDENILYLPYNPRQGKDQGTGQDDQTPGDLSAGVGGLQGGTSNTVCLVSAVLVCMLFTAVAEQLNLRGHISFA